MAADLRESAIRFAMVVLAGATDWQEAQNAFANERRFDPLWGSPDDDDVDFTEMQSVIREAEKRLDDKLPY